MPLGGVALRGGVVPRGGVIPCVTPTGLTPPVNGDVGTAGIADGVNGATPGIVAPGISGLVDNDVGSADGRPPGMGETPATFEIGGTLVGVYDGVAAFGGVSSLFCVDAVKHKMDTSSRKLNASFHCSKHSDVDIRKPDALNSDYNLFTSPTSRVNTYLG